MSDPTQHPDQTPELDDDQLEDVSGGKLKPPMCYPVDPPIIIIDPPHVYPMPDDLDLEI